MAGVIILSAITGPIAIALVLCCIGFGCAGVTRGSCAAGCHSSIGNVAAGSCFACCQSAGAGGWGAIVLHVLVMIACGTVAGVICVKNDLSVATSGGASICISNGFPMPLLICLLFSIVMSK